MSATAGAPKTLEELKNILKDDIKVKVAGIDVDGVLRGKFMSKDKFISAASSDGFGFCSVIFGWDIHDTVYSRELLISNKANGYRDILARIDLSTYRRIPWEDNVPFFLVSFLDPDTKEPLVVDPRGILRITTERAASLGFECFAGVEYEVSRFPIDGYELIYISIKTPGSLSEKKYHDLKPLTPGMHGYSLLRTQLNNDYFHDIFNLGAQFGVDIEGHHTETGPGVLETALAYTTALRMADNAILFKYLTKSIGMQRGVIPSFMAKPWNNLPGCSGHIHVSLRNSQDQNIFALPRSDVATGREGAAFEDTKYISEAAEHFLAGILDGVADNPVLLVPTINGYKRLVGGEAFWAPNAVTYGYDSRAASIRILSPPSVPPSATRFEVRIPGADMNPYFALSAVFLLGLRGIERKLKLTTLPISHFTPEDKKNGKVKMLPISLEAATIRMMRPESIAREPEMLGDVFVEHYGGTREHEVKLWNEAVTDWEVERYIELA
ncbi:probable glutamine synthetase [Armillaria ostoyae]|uniref:Glutamine synthetase n=1 Tax=Armillaria ostoyae TaxID=47428 RepID=A0A284QVH1_ARMOS|nr:probable glutamine synthetase [Armillaria ostoyae]